MYNKHNTKSSQELSPWQSFWLGIKQGSCR